MKHAFLHRTREKLFVVSCLSILLFLLISGVFRESLIFDENLHVVAGYTFLSSHNFFEEPYNPPLPREIIALPELFNHQLGNDPIFFWQRMMVVGFTIVFAITVFTVTEKLYGHKSAMVAIVFFILEPNILAHGHYAATDLILSFFIFLSIMLFWMWRYSLTKKRTVLLGIVWGLTLSCKVSALPFLVISIGLLYLISKPNKRELVSISCYKSRLYPYLSMLISALLALWATYFFTLQPALGGNINPHSRIALLGDKIPFIHYLLTQPIPLGAYINSIKQILLYNYSSAYVKSAFLHGAISQKGFHYFFPVAFLLKTQIPLLVGFFICFVYFLKRRKLSETFLLIPILSIMGISMLSTLNLGVRYILPLYPLVIVFISQCMHMQIKQKLLIVSVGIGMVWNILGIVRIYPHYLSYFNEFTGNPTYGYTYLIDSNYDWGQGLVDLAAYQRTRGIKNLQLAYFGMVPPEKYGILYTRIRDISVGEKKKLEPLRLKRGGTLAVSASCYYYCGYDKNPLLKRKPDSIVGGSILIYLLK